MSRNPKKKRNEKNQSASRSILHLGYTYGIYTLKTPDREMMRKGTYVSVWIKEEGVWRFVLDSGNEGVGE